MHSNIVKRAYCFCHWYKHRKKLRHMSSPTEDNTLRYIQRATNKGRKSSRQNKGEREWQDKKRTKYQIPIPILIATPPAAVYWPKTTCKKHGKKKNEGAVTQARLLTIIMNIYNDLCIRKPSASGCPRLASLFPWGSTPLQPHGNCFLHSCPNPKVSSTAIVSLFCSTSYDL